jgi:hypothetical protein
MILIAAFLPMDSFAQQWNGSSTINSSINRNGNVGIGTPYPAKQLHIFSTSNTAAIALENQSAKFVASSTGGFFDIDYDIAFLGGTMSGKALSIGRFGNDYFVTIDMKQKTKFSNTAQFQSQSIFNSSATFNSIATYNNNVFYNSDVSIQNSRLLLSDGANQIELTADGLVHAREIEVDLVTIPDYVFADDYNLMPLSDLKKYIDDNHHLPNIKSAKEYEERGSIALKELNIKLLEKVEELTLYTLEQEDKLNNLKEEVEALKKMIQTKSE